MNTNRRVTCINKYSSNMIYIYIYVSGSSKIQTLCHLTQVLLKLRFTVMETLTGY